VRFEHSAHGDDLLTSGIHLVLERLTHGLAPLLLLDVLLNRVSRDMTGTTDVVRPAPQRRKAAFQAGELIAQHAGRVALELVGEILWRVGWGRSNEQVDVIGQDFQTLDSNAQLVRLFVQQFFQAIRNRAVQYLAPVFGTPDKVVMQHVDAARVLFIARRTHVLSITRHSMLVNYLLECGGPALPPPPGTLWVSRRSPRRGDAVLATKESPSYGSF
jgi:hypothetical protein